MGGGGLLRQRVNNENGWDGGLKPLEKIRKTTYDFQIHSSRGLTTRRVVRTSDPGMPNITWKFTETLGPLFNNLTRNEIDKKLKYEVHFEKIYKELFFL